MSGDAELDFVREEWRRRVIAEYQSAAATHCVTFWLIQLGASPTLIHEGLRIVDDEIVHAELSFDVLNALGGASVELVADELGVRRDGELSLLQDLALQGVRIFCLGETLAVRLFKRLRDDCSEPVALRALDRVLADEVRHRDFGWTLLDWLQERDEWNSLQALIASRLATYAQELWKNYGAAFGREASAGFDERWRAWGLMPISDYQSALAEALERDFRPRFARFGLQIAEP